MMGPSANGTGWVNYNNKCPCGYYMPLPASHGKHCPKCGVQVATYPEMQGKGKSKSTCRSCGEAISDTDNFCIECGERVKP